VPFLNINNNINNSPKGIKETSTQKPLKFKSCSLLTAKGKYWSINIQITIKNKQAVIRKNQDLVLSKYFKFKSIIIKNNGNNIVLIIYSLLLALPLKEKRLRINKLVI
jgi:hypothetical protein